MMDQLCQVGQGEGFPWTVDQLHSAEEMHRFWLETGIDETNIS